MAHSSCFVPGCTTGYPSQRKRHAELGLKNPSVFKAPNEITLLEKWRRAIPRTDKLLQPWSRVCELHFEEFCIERDYITTGLPDGSVSKIKKGRPTLKPGSVPTLFPGLPKYYSKKTHRRKSPTPRSNPPPRNTRIKKTYSKKSVLDVESSPQTNSQKNVHIQKVTKTYNLDVQSTSESHSQRNTPIKKVTKTCDQEVNLDVESTPQTNFERNALTKNYDQEVNLDVVNTPQTNFERTTHIHKIAKSYDKEVNLDEESSQTNLKNALIHKITRSDNQDLDIESNEDAVPIQEMQQKNKNCQEDSLFNLIADKVSSIEIPENWWAKAHKMKHIIFVKFDDILYDRHVVIHKDLSVKVFLRNVQFASFNTINSLDDVSALLKQVDKLICKDTEFCNWKYDGSLSECDETMNHTSPCEMDSIFSCPEMGISLPFDIKIEPRSSDEAFLE